METPQPPQVSVSGRIIVEGHLPVSSSSASPENAPAPPPPPSWKWWRWPSAPVSVIASLATVILAAATALLALVSYWQLTDSHAALVAANRAWVGAAHGIIGGVPRTVGADNITVDVMLTNTGREPAINAGIDLLFDTVDVNATPEIIHQQQNSYVIECKDQKNTNQRIIIDSTTLHRVHDRIPPDKVDWGVIYGIKYVFIHGCINYDTFNKTRHTAFCYRFQAGEPNLGELTFCEQGAYAD
jgi:hypothetical protein